MAKNFDKLNGLNKKSPTAIRTKDPQTAAVSTETKKKIGRPKTKTEPTKAISIAVPVSMLEQIEIATLKYGGNLTQYVNAVLAKDLEEHATEYDTLKQMVGR